MKSKVPAKKAKLETASSNGPGPADGKPKASRLMMNTIGSIKLEPGSSKTASNASSASGSLAKVKSATENLNIAATGSLFSSPFRLTFPILPSPDVKKELPRLVSLTQNTAEGETPTTAGSQLLPIDEVDILQNELETLWSLIAMRTRIVKNQNTVLDSLLSGQSESSGGELYDIHQQEKINAKSTTDSGHGTRTSLSASAKQQGSGETSAKAATVASSSSAIVVGSSRKSNNSAAAATIASVPSPSSSARQPKKKLKAELGDKSKIGGYKPARAGQNRSHSVSMDESFLRLEAPNQFWEFADTYCRDITQQDLDDLDKEISEFRDIPESVFTIPPLGKHFSGVEKKRSSDLTRSTSARDEKDLKAAKDIVGPLTQHLVTALVEDRVAQFAVQPNSNGTREDVNGGSADFHLIPRPGLVKALGLDVVGPGAQAPLESRLKAVLAEQGLILGDEAEDPFNLNQDDEVLAEIRRTFTTLKKLHKHNVDKLEKLAFSAKREFNRLSQKKELDKADKEIISAYRALAACRIKRKPITQKERSLATKALQYRQHAVEKLTAEEQADEL